MADQTSRNLGDSGDRHQHDSLDGGIVHAPIKFLPARECSLTVMVPRFLVEQADRERKHRDDLRYELALLWRRYVADGDFSISMRMLNGLYSDWFRKRLKGILDRVASPFRNHANFPGNARCKRYRFHESHKKKRPTYSGRPLGGVALSQPAMVLVTVPGWWLWSRYERWSTVCDRNGWVSHLDLDGRTPWGRPLFDALEAASIPIEPETLRLIQRGVPKAARRKHGRCYHRLINLRKELRQAMLFDGEPTAEVDIHACYTALLISKLPDGPAKRKAIEALRNDWYSQFEAVFDNWCEEQGKLGNAYKDDSGKWMIRDKENPAKDSPASVKVEYQRQCLFWKDRRDSSNSLRAKLRQLHPELCESIKNWRKRMNPTELSHVLTRAEGSLVVDYAMAELEQANIKSVSIHDAVVVPTSQAEQARTILLGVCEWHLGFVPKVSIKVAM